MGPEPSRAWGTCRPTPVHLTSAVTCIRGPVGRECRHGQPLQLMGVQMLTRLRHHPNAQLATVPLMRRMRGSMGHAEKAGITFLCAQRFTSSLRSDDRGGGPCCKAGRTWRRGSVPCERCQQDKLLSSRTSGVRSGTQGRLGDGFASWPWVPALRGWRRLAGMTVGGWGCALRTAIPDRASGRGSGPLRRRRPCRGCRGAR
ncbi:MAG: hypothetical protein RLZ98_3615 [Pseudomonadota bacterium]|jgi:hypothetical protein